MPLAHHLPTSPTGKIMQHLQQHDACSIKDLATALGVTPNAVRQPLTSLLAAECVTAAMAQHRRGRPYFLYRLSTKGRMVFPRLYEELARAFCTVGLPPTAPVQPWQAVQRVAPCPETETSTERETPMPHTDKSRQDSHLHDLGKRLRSLRKARKLRQVDMATFGLSYKYYQRIEAGQVNPTLLTLHKVAEALEVPIGELLQPA